MAELSTSAADQRGGNDSARTSGPPERGCNRDHHRLLQCLSGMPRTEQRRTVHALVRACVAEILTLPDLPTGSESRNLVELGVDSLAAITLHERLCTGTGISLPESFFFDQDPTVQ